MPAYPYQCPACGFEDEVFAPISQGPTTPPEHCGLPMTRKYSGVAVGLYLFPAGYNPSVRAHVSDRGRLQELLKRREDEAYVHSGIETNYVLQDDPAAFGIDKDRLEWRKAQDKKPAHLRESLPTPAPPKVTVPGDGWLT